MGNRRKEMRNVHFQKILGVLPVFIKPFPYAVFASVQTSVRNRTIGVVVHSVHDDRFDLTDNHMMHNLFHEGGDYDLTLLAPSELVDDFRFVLGIVEVHCIGTDYRYKFFKMFHDRFYALSVPLPK